MPEMVETQEIRLAEADGAGTELTFEDAGEHELKGVPGRWRLYRVLA